MNKEERSRYFDELTKNLCRVGFTVNSEDAELLPVELNGQSLCCVTENGGIQYHWAGVVSDDKRAALDKVMYVAGVTFEYMRLMETAQQVAAHLPASELKGDYRVLAEFNSAVLAGQPTQHGCQFVTLEPVPERDFVPGELLWTKCRVRLLCRGKKGLCGPLGPHSQKLPLFAGAASRNLPQYSFHIGE